MIYVGTSGFGYHEWSPGFYPPGLAHEEYLRFYATRLRFCELNHTFFELPRVDGFHGTAKLARDAADGLVFTAKLHRRLTHEPSDELEIARRFADGLRPLVEAEKLGAVLAQFPFSFVNHPHNRAYLCRLRAALELPLVAELRNASWVRDETLQFLRGWGIGLAAIDAPAIGGFSPPMSVATSELGYVRLHGRNKSSWWRRDEPARYAYSYRRRELLAWIPRVRELARVTRDVFVVFNNHGQGHAADNALVFEKLLRRRSSGRRSTAARAAARVG